MKISTIRVSTIVWGYAGQNIHQTCVQIIQEAPTNVVQSHYFFIYLFDETQQYCYLFRFLDSMFRSLAKSPIFAIIYVWWKPSGTGTLGAPTLGLWNFGTGTLELWTAGEEVVMTAFSSPPTCHLFPSLNTCNIL